MKFLMFVSCLILMSCDNESDKTDKTISTNRPSTSAIPKDSSISKNNQDDTSIVAYSHNYYYDFDEAQVPKHQRASSSNQVKSRLDQKIFDGEHYPQTQPQSKTIALPSELDRTDLVYAIDPISTNEFDAHLVLEKFFPGNRAYLYSDGAENDSTQVIFWDCADCEKQEVLYCNSNSWELNFPSDNMNVTFLTGDYEFIVGDHVYRLLSFASFLDQFSISFTGRYSGSMMGNTIFEKMGKRYEFRSFQPLVNSFGAFHAISNPDIRLEDNHLFLIYGTHNGGAGGPYGDSDEILWFNGEEFFSVAKLSFLSLSNVSFGSWRSSYSFDKSDRADCPDLIVETVGYYIGKITQNANDRHFLTDSAPESFLKRCQKADTENKPFSFTLERRYSFEDGVYAESESKLSSSELEGSWEKRE